MSSKRLLARLPRAERLGVACLPGYGLFFDKAGLDGSGKCTIAKSVQSRSLVYGVLYRLHPDDKLRLDEIEGPRYQSHTLNVITPSRQPLQAACYISRHRDAGLLPFDWYLHHVYQGAQEAGLPQNYITRIKLQSAMVDSDIQRALREFNIHK